MCAHKRKLKVLIYSFDASKPRFQLYLLSIWCLHLFKNFTFVSSINYKIQYMPTAQILLHYFRDTNLDGKICAIYAFALNGLGIKYIASCFHSNTISIKLNYQAAINNILDSNMWYELIIMMLTLNGIFCILELVFFISS